MKKRTKEGSECVAGILIPARKLLHHNHIYE